VLLVGESSNTETIYSQTLYLLLLILVYRHCAAVCSPLQDHF
jgi:hypothetical protein